MAKFIMLYKGDATDPADMSAEQRSEIMAAWVAWMENVGPAITDAGAPFGPGTSIIDDGSSGDPVKLNGYTLVEAEDLAAAEALTANHPFLSEGKGDFSIELYELIPMGN